YDAFESDLLAKARAIRRARLTTADRLSLDLFVAALERNVEEQAYPGYRSLVLGSQGGAQSELADLLRIVPMDDSVQARQALARMARYPKLVDQRIEQMRRGAAMGWVTS